ncbi:TPA: hypothetical protein CPT81_05470 [Candidatus Gastranaerophilales bacterium HUM_20]|nr:unknown [Clostridium sp. CAG:729]DAB21190.1 MAG TPA: hypothetical protein CPT81_05470 [Candidatus Gastranaerophilales bacterium HUM_20]
MILKIICLILLIILELPLVIRFIRYNREYEITRQVAVTILMIITALIVWGIYKLALFVIR